MKKQELCMVSPIVLLLPLKEHNILVFTQKFLIVVNKEHLFGSVSHFYKNRKEQKS